MKIEAIEEHNEIVDLIKEAFDINFDELVFSKKWNIKKINLVLTFLKQNFDIKNALVLFCVNPKAQDIQKKENVQFILDNLKKSLNEYLK